MKSVILLALCLTVIYANEELGLTAQFYDHINSMSKTWTAGHNSRWNEFTIDTIQTQFGTFLDVPLEFQLAEKNIELVADLPEEFDSRVQWPKCESIQEVRDQATCGSCWAFGAAEAMSDRLCIASGQKIQTRISTEDLLSCCGYSCGFGCQGGFPGGAWSFFQNSGLVTGNEYNNHNWCRAYSFPSCEHHVNGTKPACGEILPTPQCTKQCHEEYAAEYDGDKIKAKDSYAVPNNVAQIQSEIFLNGPVEAAFTVYEDFLTYKSGVYQHTTGVQHGGHAIKILGWGVENSIPYWLCANSWNEDWGNQGFFKIIRGSNHCGIEAQITAGTVAV